MNHTTRLHETRGQKSDQEYSPVEELSLEDPSDEGGRASEE
jgi:hypothetical protein